MSQTKMKRLEDDELWRIAREVALYGYNVLQDLPDEERYGMEQQLRDRSFDLTNDIAEAVGSTDPREKSYSYGRALRDAFSVRNTFIMANKTGMLQVEPSVFVRIDELTNGLYDEVNVTTEQIPDYLKHFSFEDIRHED